MDENQNFQPTSGDGTYGYTPQQSTDGNQYGYQTQQSMNNMQYGYSSQAPMYNPQYGYQQNTYAGEQLAPVMKVSDWIITYLLMCITCVGLILMFVWAFGDSANPNKKNLCRAMLIIAAIAIVLYCIIAAYFIAVLGGTLSEFVVIKC